MIAGLGDWGFALMDQALPNQFFQLWVPAPTPDPSPGRAWGRGPG